MKKSTAIPLALGAFMLAIFVYQAFAANVLLDHTCTTNPFSACVFAQYGIATGMVEAEMNGLCDAGSNIILPEVTARVYAWNCYPYVDIHAGAYAYYYGLNGLDANAFTIQCAVPIYEMWDGHYCNGDSPGEIPPAVGCGGYGQTCG